jgi:hypothetical protein
LFITVSNFIVLSITLLSDDKITLNRVESIT